jgi:hypothetical protein
MSNHHFMYPTVTPVARPQQLPAAPAATPPAASAARRAV